MVFLAEYGGYRFEDPWLQFGSPHILPQKQGHHGPHGQQDHHGHCLKAPFVAVEVTAALTQPARYLAEISRHWSGISLKQHRFLLFSWDHSCIWIT